MEETFEKIKTLVQSKDRTNIELGIMLAISNKKFTKLKEYLDDFYGELLASMAVLRSLRPFSTKDVTIERHNEILDLIYEMNNKDNFSIKSDTNKLPKNLEYLPIKLLVAYNGKLVDISDLYKLKDLQYVFLSENRIEELPLNIGELLKINILELDNNRIREIPESIIKLNNLKTLKLYKNRISEIPEGLLQLENLESLDLSDNIINKLPENLTFGNNMKALNLNRNKLPKSEVQRLKEANPTKRFTISCLDQQLKFIDTKYS